MPDEPGRLDSSVKTIVAVVLVCTGVLPPLLYYLLDHFAPEPSRSAFKRVADENFLPYAAVVFPSLLILAGWLVFAITQWAIGSSTSAIRFLTVAGLLAAVVFIPWQIWVARTPPTIHTGRLAGAQFHVAYVTHRAVTSLCFVSVNRATILWELHGNAEDTLRDSNIRFGETPQGSSWQQRVPDGPGEKPADPPDGELVVASIRYINDHLFAPGMGGHCVLCRWTAGTTQLVELDNYLVFRVSWHVEQLHPSRMHLTPAERNKEREALAECLLELASYFRRAGDEPEARKWIEHVRESYDGTVAATKAAL